MKSMAKFIFLLLLALIVTSVQAKDTSLNIACGRSVNFTDPYGNEWLGDGQFATLGYAATISSSYASKFEPLNTLRYFPNDSGVYYSFKLVPAGTRVTITTQFYYGNYDGKSNPPTFFVRYDDYEWHQIYTYLSSNVTYTQTYTTSGDTIIVYLGVPEGDYTNVSFVNTIQISGPGIKPTVQQGGHTSNSSAPQANSNKKGGYTRYSRTPASSSAPASSAPASSAPKANRNNKGANVAVVVAPIVVVLLLVIIGLLVWFFLKRKKETAQGRMYPNPGRDERPSIPQAYDANMQGSAEDSSPVSSIPTSDSYMKSTAQEKYYPSQGPKPKLPAPSMEASNMQYSQGNNAKPSFVDPATRNFFTYADIVAITKNFEKQIGRGGSASVYHGQLKNGIEVAVKVLNQSLPHGAKEFASEVQPMLTIHHRCITRFVGYCDEGQSLILVYEYMKGGNLREVLSGEGRRAAGLLTWEKRLHIALNVATGLDYLHSDCIPSIIHRDMKSTNILLNEKLQAKITDFGLARAGKDEDEVTHVITMLAGTPGYIDPEYCQTNMLTKKSDVYSFGVVLYELVSGHSPILSIPEGCRCNLVQWMKPLLERRDVASIADPNLRGQYNADSMWKVAFTAMACTEERSSMRPTMSDVVSQLKEAIDVQKTSHEPTGDFASTSPSRMGHGVLLDESVPASTSSSEHSSSYNPLVAPLPAR